MSIDLSSPALLIALFVVTVGAGVVYAMFTIDHNLKKYHFRGIEKKDAEGKDLPETVALKKKAKVRVRLNQSLRQVFALIAGLSIAGIVAMLASNITTVATTATYTPTETPFGVGFFIVAIAAGGFVIIGGILLMFGVFVKWALNNGR